MSRWWVENHHLWLGAQSAVCWKSKCAAKSPLYVLLIPIIWLLPAPGWTPGQKSAQAPQTRFTLSTVTRVLWLVAGIPLPRLTMALRACRVCSKGLFSSPAAL